MPQLMPLYWMISSMFMIILLMTIILIYSNSLSVYTNSSIMKDKKIYYWCW